MNGKLFILDDEGVLHFPPRQELRSFNSAATFIWCCLEEGMDAPAVVEAYADAFDVDRHQANMHVSDTLHRWWGLGYIEQPLLPPVASVDFTTALGWLMSNPPLQQRFKQSPADLARDLRLHPVDDASFLQLDADALAALSRQMRPARRARGEVANSSELLFSAMASTTESLTHYALRCRLAHEPSDAFLHHYRLLDTSFAVRYASRRQVEQVHPALAQLTVTQPAQIHVRFDVLEGSLGQVIMEGPLPRRLAREHSNLAPLMKDLLRQTALNRTDFFAEIHAAVVSDGSNCLMLPGDPGSGKSTLTAGLVVAGYEYFSDEMAVLSSDTLELVPAPLALGIKPGALDVLGDMHPSLRQLPVHDREDGQQVRYLNLRPDQIVAADVRRPARWLVFPRYDRDAVTELRPLSRGDALRRLLGQCMVLPTALDEKRVTALVGWMNTLQCYELPMSSLPDAIALLSRLIPLSK